MLNQDVFWYREKNDKNNMSTKLINGLIHASCVTFIDWCLVNPPVLWTWQPASPPYWLSSLSTQRPSVHPGLRNSSPEKITITINILLIITELMGLDNDLNKQQPNEKQIREMGRNCGSRGHSSLNRTRLISSLFAMLKSNPMILYPSDFRMQDG